MAHSTEAIRKGMAAEYLAKAFFSKQGYAILLPDSHETSYDFIAFNSQVQERVQVKSDVAAGDLIRFRNKRGQNASYGVDDYDLLCGVWVDKSIIYLFYSHEVNDPTVSLGVNLTVGAYSGRPLSKHERLIPFYTGRI